MQADLLVAPLHGAVPLIQVHHIAVVVCQYLHLYVAWGFHILLYEHAPIPKGGLGFVAGPLKGLRQVLLCSSQTGARLKAAASLGTVKCSLDWVVTTARLQQIFTGVSGPEPTETAGAACRRSTASYVCGMCNTSAYRSQAACNKPDCMTLHVVHNEFKSQHMQPVEHLSARHACPALRPPWLPSG